MFVVFPSFPKLIKHKWKISPGKFNQIDIKIQIRRWPVWWELKAVDSLINRQGVVGTLRVHKKAIIKPLIFQFHNTLFLQQPYLK